MALYHGDFCRQNILINNKASLKNQIGIIDWTDSAFEGLPLSDLLYFLISYCMQIRKGTGSDVFIQLFENKE